MLKTLLPIAASFALAGCGLLGSNPEQPLDDLFVGVNYVGLTVADIDASSDYYTSAFAVEALGEGDLAIGDLPEGLAPAEVSAVRTVLMRSTNAQLRLMSFAGEDYQPPKGVEAVPVQGPGIMHVCFQAKQETNIYTNALAAGARPIGAKELVQLSDRNPVRYGYIMDGQGIITEVEEVDVAQLDLPEPPKHDYRMRHVALATPDVETMASFYSALLGGQPPRRIGRWIHLSGDKADQVSGLPGSEIEMAWFQLRNLEIEIAQYHSHATTRPEEARPIDAPGYNMIVFDVADVDRARARLIEAGGELVGESAALDGARIVFGRDPDGNLLGLQALPQDSIYSAKNFAGNGT